MRRLAALFLITLPALRGAEVLDRIAVTVGTEIITLTEVLREIRLQALQENGTIDTSPRARRAAAERLVDRTLITMEMTRRVVTNVAAPAGPHAPMGQLARLRNYPTPAETDVTTPNARLDSA